MLLSEKTVYQDEQFVVTEWGGRYYMYWTDSLIAGTPERAATIIYGKEGLDKNYKGSFEKWIKAVRKRDYETMLSYETQAEELLKKAKFLKAKHKFGEEKT